MKKIHFLLISCLLIFTTAKAQQDSVWAKPSPEIDYAREVIKNLCDARMKGRGFAGGGDQLAADYILTEMRSIGVMPIGGNFFQKFPVNANTFPARMSIYMGKEKASLQAGYDFWVDPSCPSVIGEYKLIYISRKQMNDRLVLLDKLRDAKDGFILIDNSDKSEETPEMTKKLNDLIQKIKTDMQVQLRGVMIYDPKAKLSWSTVSTQSSRAIIYVAKEMDIAEISSARFEIDAEYKTNYMTNNVVGIIEGSVKPDSAIILTAHYDHLGLMGKDLYFPGANSNASGVAMLLSLAKHFERIQPKYSIIFIALGAEEVGLAGSQAYTDYPAKPLAKSKFIFNFDLVGTGKVGAKAVNGTTLPGQYKTLSDICRTNKYLPKMEPRGEFCRSAQCNFNKKGVPGFWIYTLGDPNNYHDLNDTPENLPLTSYENYFNMVIKFIEGFK